MKVEVARSEPVQSFVALASAGKQSVPYLFEFDSTQQILRARFEGRVTDAELKEYYPLANQHIARLKPRVGIADFTGVTSFDVSSQTIRDLADTEPATPGPDARFVVAPAAHIFGLARMFQVYGGGTRPNFHVVSTLSEVYAFIGVREAKFERVE